MILAIKYAKEIYSVIQIITFHLSRLKGTDWGCLDVLILDMPPGTGDVQLTICQELELSGAISVTTPSRLAVEDAKKGIEMFTSLGVPTLAMVENMSYFDVSYTIIIFLPLPHALIQQLSSNSIV